MIISYSSLPDSLPDKYFISLPRAEAVALKSTPLPQEQNPTEVDYQPGSLSTPSSSEATPHSEVIYELATDGEQARERLSLHAGVERFIARMKARATKEDFPKYSIASRAEDIWMDSQQSFDFDLPVPTLSLGPDGGIQFTWRNGVALFSFDIVELGAEVYYTNGETEEEFFLPFGIPPLEVLRDGLAEVALAQDTSD